MTRYQVVPSTQFRKDLKRAQRLSGDYVHCRECHITPDWLLLYLVRTGSHSDLF